MRSLASRSKHLEVRQASDRQRDTLARMSDPMVIPIYCQHCSKPLTLIVTAEGPKSLTTTWTCPWCEKRNSGALDGRVVEVQVGHKA